MRILTLLILVVLQYTVFEPIVRAQDATPVPLAPCRCSPIPAVYMLGTWYTNGLYPIYDADGNIIGEIIGKSNYVYARDGARAIKLLADLKNASTVAAMSAASSAADAFMKQQALELK